MSTKSTIQSCLRVFLPDSTTFFISFTSDSSVSISFVLALKKSSLYPPPYALASASQPPGTICCPGLSRRFTCSVYAQDVFLAIFLEGFADVISIDFLHPCCFGLRGSTVLPPSFIFATCLYNHWASTR